jgi:glyoxylase-like metal-dependent hydrolase (beta-lactamase superfamily II)
LPGLRDVKPDRWLREGEQVTLGAHRFDVLHCPGHTPGHIVFVNRAERFAILGDVLFQGSVGRTDFPYGDHAALIRSIRDKLLPLGDDLAFLCGHGAGSTIGAERESNPFL